MTFQLPPPQVVDTSIQQQGVNSPSPRRLALIPTPLCSAHRVGAGHQHGQGGLQLQHGPLRRFRVTEHIKEAAQKQRLLQAGCWDSEGFV